MKRWKRIAAIAMVAVAAAGMVAPAFAFPPKYHGEWCKVEEQKREKGRTIFGLCSRMKPEAAAQVLNYTITENAVKIHGTAAPWVYEIKNQGPQIERYHPEVDFWQVHMRGSKEMLTYNFFRTTGTLKRNDGTVEEVPILIVDNITGSREHQAYIDMNRRVDRMERIYKEPAPH